MSCEALFLSPQPRAPLFDGRNKAALLAELVGRLPGFTPEWRVGTGEAGWALLAVYARYLEILADGVNRLPERSLLAFLDLFGDSLITAQSSRVPLVFTLLPTSPSDVELPARSSVAAKLPPPAPSFLASGAAAPSSGAPLFYTTQTVSLARAQLVAVRSIEPASDCYTDVSANLRSGFVAFDERTPVAHVLYLGHDKLFALTGTAEVVLAVAFSEAARPERTLVLDWEYLSHDGWLPLQVTDDTTERLTKEGRITLAKSWGPDSKQDALNGRVSYWIRARLNLARPFVNIGNTHSLAIDVDAAVAWSSNDLLNVDGVVRGIVDSVIGAHVNLQQAVHFDVGEKIEVAGKASARVVRAPVTSVLVDFAYPLLAGDGITVDGESTTTIRRVRPGVLELDGPLDGAEPGAQMFLASTPPPLRPEGFDALGPLPRFDALMARVGVSKSGLQADAACCDAVPLDLHSPFYPFGQQPSLFTTFYVSNEEAFVLAGAQLQLHFTLAKAVAAGASAILSWEYFDGQSWLALGIVQDFLDATQSLTIGGIVRFDCPADWAACEVNGASRHWLRARLDSGDFGRPMELQVTLDSNKNPVVTSVASTLAPPIVSKLRLDYTFFSAFELPDACVSCNDFVFRDHGADARGYRSAFEPFIPIDDRARALHWGFSERLPAGLMSTYVRVEDGTGEPAMASPFVWEYRSAEGWAELTVLDATNGFTTSGMLQWVGPPDAVATPGFGGTLFRIRARLRLGETLEPTRFAAVWPNAVWGVQGETVHQLVLGESDGNPGQSFPFRADRVPVLPGETIEVREWTGHGDDWQTAVPGVPSSDLRFEREAVTGVPTAVWVRWYPRPTFYGASRDDRVYTIERSAGLLKVGNDTHGRIPPAGARIVASFATGGDIVGNVPAFSITELRTGVAYLQGVSNPIAASGGAATELLAAIERRGPQQFRHRDRNVSFEDYEWLARRASPDVARVRCLPLTGPGGRPQRGCVSLLVAPQSNDPRPSPSVELARRVREFLAQHGPATVSRNIGITAPRYVPVSVHVDVVPRVAGDAASVDQCIRDACDRFLHPLFGGSDGRGWQFGQSVYLSQIAALIEGLDAVDYCSNIDLSVGDALAGDRIAMGPDGIVASGEHEVKIVLVAPAVRVLLGAG